MNGRMAEPLVVVLVELSGKGREVKGGVDLAQEMVRLDEVPEDEVDAGKEGAVPAGAIKRTQHRRPFSLGESSSLLPQLRPPFSTPSPIHPPRPSPTMPAQDRVAGRPFFL